MKQIIEDRHSLFTDAERESHQETEFGLVAKAKLGNLKPLLKFWTEKKRLFLQRAFERSPYAKALA